MFVLFLLVQLLTFDPALPYSVLHNCCRYYKVCTYNIQYKISNTNTKMKLCVCIGFAELALLMILV